MSVVICFNHSTHPAKDHLIQAFLHHTDRSLNHLEFALSPFVEDYYASPCRRGSVSYKFIQLSLGSSLPGRNGIPNPLDRITEPEDTTPCEWDECKSNEKWSRNVDTIECPGQEVLTAPRNEKWSRNVDTIECPGQEVLTAPRNGAFSLLLSAAFSSLRHV